MTALFRLIRDILFADYRGLFRWVRFYLKSNGGPILKRVEPEDDGFDSGLYEDLQALFDAALAEAERRALLRGMSPDDAQVVFGYYERDTSTIAQNLVEAIRDGGLFGGSWDAEEDLQEPRPQVRVQILDEASPAIVDVLERLEELQAEPNREPLDDPRRGDRFELYDGRGSVQVDFAGYYVLFHYENPCDATPSDRVVPREEWREFIESLRRDDLGDDEDLQG